MIYIYITSTIICIPFFIVKQKKYSFFESYYSFRTDE